MDITKRIERINEFCGRSLDMTCYGRSWAFMSYGPGTPLESYTPDGVSFEEALRNTEDYLSANYPNFRRQK